MWLLSVVVLLLTASENRGVSPPQPTTKRNKVNVTLFPDRFIHLPTSCRVQWSLILGVQAFCGLIMTYLGAFMGETHKAHEC